MRTFSVTELKILEALAQFQYLTSSQMVRLGIVKSRKTIYPHLARLSKQHKPAIGRVHYTINPIHGKPESTVFLTRDGMKWLVESGYEPSLIKYPKQTTVNFASDYQHRLWTVDFFISVRNWAERSQYEMGEIEYYFQQSATNRNNKGGRNLAITRIDIDLEGKDYIWPDGICIIEREHTKPVFIFFEQHNGKDTKRFLEQVHGHVLAIREGIPAVKYGVKHAGQFVSNRVFCCFEYESCMVAAMRRLAQSDHFKPYLRFFLFRTTESLNAGTFEDGWLLASGHEAEI